MRKLYLVSGVVAVTAAVVLLNLPPSPALAHRENSGGKSPTAYQLPIGQVVLFSSGVGYFQREGQVEGSQRVDLTFPIQDINDLIKSLTLRDLDGGHISAVSYDSNVPVERTLQSFAINLTGNPSFGAILTQARGEKVEVVLQQTNATQPGTLTGSIIGIEKQRVPVGKDGVAESECLNLWCADGMRSLKLSEVQRVRFLNAIVESEFKKALETLASGHDTQKKAVSIHFAGKGKRQVTVGYVIENPVWKTTYRLALAPNAVKKDPDDPPLKAYLQGWGVVENQTDEDWNGVRMALISGRPISFQMNLYDALFIKRPTVEPELFASLRPPTYSGGFMRADDGLAMDFAMPKPESGASTLLGRAGTARDRKPADGKERNLGLMYQNGQQGKLAEQLHHELADNLNLGKAVQSAATASKLGDYFQYTVDHPVNLPRQKSALLPIVGQDVWGERVSIYNENTHAKFPLLGLVFKNSTGMHLTQGPITVYEGSTYAGDARILDLQKDERRLLSYAIDLGTEVMPVNNTDNGRITSVRIVKGIVYTTTKVKESKTYTIANRNDADRIVMLEHPHRTDFKLTMEDKPWETAADFHRFKVTVPAGKTTKYVVSEERDFGSSVALTNSDDHNIRITLNQPVTSPKVKKALEEALALRGKLAATQREMQQIDRELALITQDQDRLRKNLKEMPQDAVAYKRYLKKFDDQETQIEALQKRQKAAHEAEYAERMGFEKFLANLSVE